MIETFANPSALAVATAKGLADTLWKGMRENGAASLVATGGRSPGVVYDRLSEIDLDWSKVRITLSDERWAPTSDPESNERLVRTRLVRGRAAPARLVGLRGLAETPQEAAEKASAALGAWPVFDAVLLGMGEDGHVASLFPQSPALAPGLDPAAPDCIAVPQGAGRAPPQPRLSLTLQRLVRARQVIILIGGAHKRAVMEQALDGHDAMELPVRAIVRSAPSLRILWSA